MEAGRAAVFIATGALTPGNPNKSAPSKQITQNQPCRRRPGTVTCQKQQFKFTFYRKVFSSQDLLSLCQILLLFATINGYLHAKISL